MYLFISHYYSLFRTVKNAIPPFPFTLQLRQNDTSELRHFEVNVLPWNGQMEIVQEFVFGLGGGGVIFAFYFFLYKTLL